MTVKTERPGKEQDSSGAETPQAATRTGWSSLCSCGQDASQNNSKILRSPTLTFVTVSRAATERYLRGSEWFVAEMDCHSSGGHLSEAGPCSLRRFQRIATHASFTCCWSSSGHSLPHPSSPIPSSFLPPLLPYLPLLLVLPRAHPAQFLSEELGVKSRTLYKLCTHAPLTCSPSCPLQLLISYFKIRAH